MKKNTLISICFVVISHCVYSQDIKLDTTTNIVKMTEIVVTPKKSSFKMDDNKLIYEIKVNPLYDNSTLQAMRYVPTIRSGEGGFSIIGKDRTVVYINGKKSRFTQSALSAYLSGLPADRIESIEVINNPGSQYEGSGDFGIVNIVLKRNEKDGVRGTVSAGVRKTHYFKENANLNLSFKKNKLSGNVILGVDINSDWGDREIYTLYKESLLETRTNTITDGRNNDYTAALALDYELTKKTVIGIFSNFSFYKENLSEKGETIFGMSNSSVIDSVIAIDYNSNISKPEITTNINLRTKFNKKSMLNIDVDYINHYNKYDSENLMDIVIGDNSPTNYDNFKQFSPQTTNIVSAKADYSYRAGDFSINSGLSGYYSNIDNDNQFLSHNGNDYVLDKVQSNNFVLTEYSAALYFNMRYKFSKKFTAGLGARLEHTYYQGEQRTTSTDFDKKYWNVLPSMFMNYNTTIGSFNYALSYRISRPPFQALNPFIVYTSPTSYAVGNPYLEPIKLTYQNLNWSYKNFYVRASHQRIDDMITGVRVIKDNNIIEITPQNINSQHKLALLISYNLKYMNKKATLNASVNFSRIIVDGEYNDINLGYNFNSADFSLNNYFVLSKERKWGFEVSIQGYTKQKYNNNENPASFQGGLELYKSVGNFRISAFAFQSLYLSEGSLSRTQKYIYNVSNINSITHKLGESGGFGIRVTYNFGNKKLKKLKSRQTSSSDVKGRI